MRFSDSFIPTLRDDPAEAEISSHKLMVRAGLLRKSAAGLYSWLPIGLRVLRNVEKIVREEMDSIGSLELLMPILQPAELWEASGRWDAYGDEMMRLKDRSGRRFCLSPTHEEMITSIANELKSYKDLPKTLYQIQMKFRDEIRPRFGVMRSREFLMKDAYSFHADETSLAETYGAMRAAYGRILERCGLNFRPVKAAGGLIGGAVSEEFMVLADTGEDEVIYCPDCHYGANVDAASSNWRLAERDSSPKVLEKVRTPGKQSVEEVADFLGVGRDDVIKTMIVKAGDRVVAALVPGSRELNTAKLADVLGAGEIELFTQDDFAERPDLVYGFVGPVKLKGVTVVADLSLKTIKNAVVGADEADHHLLNVNIGRDFSVDTWADLIYASIGDGCPECEKGRLETMRGIEVGHIFQLGTKYSSILDAKFIDASGQAIPFIMGCYGVGVSRIVAAAIEQKADDQGMVWPASIAPFDAHLMLLSKDDRVKEEAGLLYGSLCESLEILFDDRPVSAGIKFSDADLLGIPVQLIVGKNFAQNNMVEVKVRATGERLELAAQELGPWLLAGKDSAKSG